MKKIVKIGFPIVCVGVIVVTFGMINDIKKKTEIKKQNSGSKEESHYENDVQNDVENVIESDVQDDVDNVIESESKNEIESDTESSFFGTETDVNINKAIYILKEQIEIDEEKFYLTSEGEENGRYIIAVRNIETTTTEQYYIIDLQKQKVEIYY